MAAFKTPATLPRFNQALNSCKGDGSEAELAAALNCTPRTVYNWRRGKLPTAVMQLLNCPEALRALADDIQLGSHDTTHLST
jgi:hypothetical protein